MSLITECILQDKKRTINNKIYEPAGMKVVLKNGKEANYINVETAQVITIDDKLYLTIQLLLDSYSEDIIIDLMDVESIGIRYRVKE